MRCLDIGLGQVYVDTDDVEARVTQDALQGEYITPVAQVADGEGMAEGVRGAADSLNTRLPGIPLK